MRGAGEAGCGMSLSGSSILVVVSILVSKSGGGV